MRPSLLLVAVVLLGALSLSAIAHELTHLALNSSSPKWGICVGFGCPNFDGSYSSSSFARFYAFEANNPDEILPNIVMVLVWLVAAVFCAEDVNKLMEGGKE